MCIALSLPYSAVATNHLLRQDELMAGLNGDPTIQYLVITVGGGDQKAWGPNGAAASRAMLVFFDGAGIETGRFFFPENAPPGGNSVLIATTNFAALPGAPIPDFLIPPLINPGSGKVCFRGNPANQQAFDVNLCLSYGTFPASQTEGAGPPAPTLPISGEPQSLKRVQNFGLGQTTSRNADFALGVPSPVNTRGQTLRFPVDGPEIDFLPPSINFGQRNLNDGPSGPLTLIITNHGTVNALVLTNVALAGVHSNQFQIVSDSGQTNLPPGARRTIAVTFDPTTAGSKTGLVRVASNDANEPLAEARLTGFGFDPNAPNIVVFAQTPLQFPNRNIDNGPGLEQQITIQNQANIGSLALSNITIIGPDAGQFQIVSATNASILPPFGTRTVSLRFDPSTAGRKTAFLRIVSNDPDEPVIDLELRGAGFDLNPCLAFNAEQVFAQDDCVDAQLIAPGFILRGSLFTSTSQDGSSSCSFGGGDLWYRYVPSRPGTVIVSVLGDGLVPALSAHHGCPGTTDNEIACDSGSDRGTTNATITFTVTNGMEILLRISGFAFSGGEFQLSLNGPPSINADRNQNGVSDNCEFDFGDAPAPYPSTLVANGARHRTAGELLLGRRIDSDADGQPTALATGDNLDGQANDEDGVTLLSPMVAGQSQSPRVFATTNGLLQGWVDFNADGDWQDEGEQIFINQPVVGGANSLSFSVPATATVTNRTFARFRLSSAGGLGVAGEAADGEVEDYAVEIAGGPPTPSQIAVRINEVMAGLNGDSTIQFIEIEADGDANKGWGPQGSETMGRAMLAFFDAAGMQSGRFVFPSNAPSGGNTVLIATPAFVEATGIRPDFIMGPEIVPIAGKVVFRSNPDNEHFHGQVALSYGGGNYFGPTDGAGPASLHEVPIMHARSLLRVADVPFGVNDNSAFTLAAPTPQNTAGQTFTFATGSIVAQGRTLFTRETFRGNGRTCATCHVEGKDQFGLTPETIAQFPEDDPLFVFAPNVNRLRLIGRSQPGDLRGQVTGTRGKGKILGGSGDTYLVIGGTNLSGTITDENGNVGSVESVSVGDLNGPTASNGSRRGLEDHHLLEHGRGLILENIDGFTRGEVFRASPHLLELAFTAPFGLSGEFDNLEDFSEGAVIQHFPRSLSRVSGTDFRHPTREELEAMTAFMLGISRPATNVLDLDRLATTEAQRRGREMFFGDEGRCSKCHSGPVLALSDGSLFGSLKDVNENFNTGVANILRNLPVLDNLPTEPAGLTPGQSTREFNTPSLFNIRFTAPFFHDGSAATLTEAVKFYDSEEFHDSPAGQEIGSLLAANKAEKIADVVAFLEALVELPVDFPRQLPFGVRCPGDPPRVPLSVTITNISQHFVSVTNMVLRGTNVSEFSVESDTGETNLAPGQTRTLVVRFSPNGLGLRTASIEFDAIDTNRVGAFSFGVFLTGADLDSFVEAVPAAIDFGARDIDAPPSPEDSIVITNSGSMPLEIAIDFIGPHTNDFTFFPDSSPIPPGGTRVLVISFQPLRQGNKSALIRVRLLACNTSLIEIPITGRGTSTIQEFVWDTIAGTQFVGVPFPVRITARDRNQDVVESYRGVVQFAAFSNQGIGPGITPTNSSPFRNGVWTGSITILGESGGMLINCFDSQGHGGSSDFFEAVLRDDLSITGQAPFSNNGEPLQYVLRVHNTGPSDALGVVLTNQLSPGVSFVSGSSTHGAVMHDGGIVTCSLGTVAGSATAVVQLSVTVLPVTNFLAITNVAIVGRSEPEMVLSNNIATNITFVSPFPVLTVTPDTNFATAGFSGGPFSPANRPYTLRNIGGGSLTWQARASGCHVASGIAAWWPFDGNASDISSTNAGVVIGNGGFTNGVVGSAMRFDGDDPVRVAASPVLDVGGANGFTIEAWINPAGVSQSAPIVGWRGDDIFSGAIFWIGLTVAGPGSLAANISDTGGGSHLISSGPNVLTPGVWQHVALTYDRTTGLAVLFHNGNVAAQLNVGVFRPRTDSEIFIGQRPFAGLMDELSIYSRALTQPEIQSVVSAGVFGKCAAGTAANCPLPSGLVGWWPLDGTPGDIVGGNDAFLFNSPNFTTGFVAQALFFDGADEAIRVPVTAALDFGQREGMTFEAWVNVNDITRRNPLFEFDNGTSIAGPFVFISANVPGSLHADMTDTFNLSHVMISPGGLFNAGTWTHIALTYRKVDGRTTLYVNGNVVAQQTLGNFTLRTTGNLFIGRRGAIGAEESFVGMIDEPSVYNRELAPQEIQAIFAASSSGKCRTGTWLNFAPGSGTIGPGATATVFVGLNTTANRLPLGVHFERFLFTNVTNGRGIAERSATITVINRPPTFSFVGSTQIQMNEDSPQRIVTLATVSAGFSETQQNLTITAAASDTNILNPVFVTYTNRATTGRVTFQPVTNAHGTSLVSVVIRDDGGTAHSARDSFTNILRVTVLPVNDRPTILAVPDMIIPEGSLLSITNLAQDVDLPFDTLTFSLINPPVGALVDPASGVLTWKPAEAQGPSTNRLKVAVRDSGTPQLSATNEIAITVLEVNSPPVFPLIGERLVHEGAVLSFNLGAVDPDIPPNVLTYSMQSAPPMANLDPVSGLFSWVAEVSQIPETNSVTARVSDDGNPPLEDNQIFNVIVVARPRIDSVAVSGGELHIRWLAIPGTRYMVEWSSSPENQGWADLPGEVVATEAVATKSTASTTTGQQFYRVRVLP